MATAEDAANDYEEYAKNAKGGKRSFWREAGLLARMSMAVAKGEFHLPSKQILMMIGTLGYVVSPIDTVPDLLPVIGFADDAGVVAITLSVLAYDIAMFRQWEKENGR